MLLTVLGIVILYNINKVDLDIPRFLLFFSCQNCHFAILGVNLVMGPF